MIDSDGARPFQGNPADRHRRMPWVLPVPGISKQRGIA